MAADGRLLDLYAVTDNVDQLGINAIVSQPHSGDPRSASGLEFTEGRGVVAMNDPVMAIDADGWPLMLAASPSRSSWDGSTTSLSSTKHRDLVRELAREFEDLSPQDVRERVGAEILTVNDSAKLAIEVRVQVIDDLVDLLDQRHRGRLRARRTVRVQAPRGYTQRVLSGLSASEIADVSSRLVARGWTGDDVRRVMPLGRG